MAKILLIVDFPNVIWQNTGQVSPELADRTEQFETTAGGIGATTSGSIRLSRNAWLFDAKNSWHLLQPLLDLAKTCRFTYSLLVVEGEVSHMNAPPPPIGKASIAPLRI